MHNWLGPFFATATEHGAEASHVVHNLGTELGLMGISVLVAVGGILLAVTAVLRRPAIAEELRSDYSFLYDLFLNKWWVDELYDMVVIRPLHWIGGIFWTIIDGKGIDGTLHGIADGAQYSGRFLARLQTGFVQNYALSMAAGLVFVLIWAFF